MRFDEMASSESKSNSKKEKVLPKVEEKKTSSVEVESIAEDGDAPIYGVTNKKWVSRLKRTNFEAYQRLLNWD